MLTNFAFEKALIRPVDELKLVAVDDEPGRVSISLDDVFGFGVSIFESGRWMLLFSLL